MQRVSIQFAGCIDAGGIVLRMCLIDEHKAAVSR